MNECKVCNKECTGNTCSGACRAKLSRQSRVLEHQDSAQIQRTRTVETEAHGNEAHAAFIPCNADLKVYGLKAVSYEGDRWPTRPMPLDCNDTPHSGGRGKYTRQDGTVYQFDSNGTAFEVTAGKVYQTTAEVRECYV